MVTGQDRDDPAWHDVLSVARVRAKISKRSPEIDLADAVFRRLHAPMQMTFSPGDREADVDNAGATDDVGTGCAGVVERRRDFKAPAACATSEVARCGRDSGQRRAGRRA
jgi:hypothetical protein